MADSLSEPKNAVVPASESSASVVEKKNVKKTTPKKFFRYLRLLVYANPTWVDYCLLVVGFFAAIAAGVPFPIMGILFGELVDDLNSATCSEGIDGSHYQHEVNKNVLRLVYITIGQFVLVWGHLVCWSLVGERLAQRLRDRYFSTLLRQEAAFFDDLPAGEVSSRLSGDIRTIQGGTSEKVGICLASFSFFVTAYVVAFIKNAKLAGILISLVPAFMVMSLVGSYFIEKYAGAMSDHLANAASVASEGLSHVMVVHAFNANARLESRFTSCLQEARRQGIRKAIATAIQAGLLYFIAYAANGLAFWQGSQDIADSVGGGGSGTSVGATYTVIFILVDATLVLSQVAPFLQIFGSAAAAFEKLDRDMRHESSIDGTSEDVGLFPQDIEGSLSLSQVSFSYPSRPDKTVLEDVSISLPAGKHTAIVGLSGSGKSTVAGLLLRLYDPLQGKMLLDGHDMKTLNVRHLRSHFSLVQQEPSLLDRSILENIALGLVNSPKHDHLRSALLGSELYDLAEKIRSGLSAEEAARSQSAEAQEIFKLVQQAAMLADAHSFIESLAYGYATTVGSSGSLVSGGQKQRVSVARALVKDPRIMILDEATSALDSASEKRIQGAIDKIAAAGSRTIVSIAHRLSSIRNADKIIVMRHGRIVEEGSHSELLSKAGAYFELVKLQNLNQDDNTAVQDPIRAEAKYDDQVSIEAEKEAAESIFAVEDGAVTPTEEAPEVEPLPSNRSTWSIIKSISPLLRPQLHWLLLAFLSAIVVGGSYSGEAVIFGQTVGELSPCNEESRIRSKGNFYGLMFFILAIIEFFANLLSWSSFGLVAEKLLYAVRTLSFRSLFEQDLQWHESENRTPSSLLSFITNDGNALGSLTGSVIGTIFSIVINLFVAIILTHIIAWRIALVCLVMVPILLVAGLMQLRVLSQFEERHEAAFGKSIGITMEAVNTIKTVASLSLEHEVLQTYRRSLANPIREVTKKSIYANVWLAISYSIGNLIYSLAYWWGAKQIIAGRYSQTQFFIVLIALLVSAQLWGEMFVLAPDVSMARAAVARIMNLLDIGSSKISNKSVVASFNKSSSDVEAHGEKSSLSAGHNLAGLNVSLNSLTFSYPARPTVQVLNGLSLTMQPGKFHALVGPSGAGKSTIIALIERMYTPSSGHISIEGADIAKRDGTSFRNDIALVPQDSFLFDGTVAFNVGLGARPNQDATQAEIEEACKLANIHDTIMGLPQGYSTTCGPNGSQLSGGQKQRLAIARALVRNPRLLLLDESTSALDAESERLFQIGLERIVNSGNVTVVAIAHRLHTIKKADIIFLIEDGKCVDQGRHEELIERSQSYKVNVMHQVIDT